MKQTILLICVLMFSGCVSTSWVEMSNTEKQAWIFGGAIVIAAAALSQQEDKIILMQDNCFESHCGIPK